jgi:hypothetical protein
MVKNACVFKNPNLQELLNVIFVCEETIAENSGIFYFYF